MRCVKQLTLILLATLLPFLAVKAQQSALLYLTDFDINSGGLTINSPNGLNDFGSNLWTVNSNYDGLGIYPNTPDQLTKFDTVGNIAFPNGNYLHIVDNNSTALNANYNPNVASDRWVIIDGGGICTWGYDDILVSFWWTAKGNNFGFGEMYYSADGGATWNLTTNRDGDTKYKDMPVWKYTEVTMPGFKNLNGLLLAFRWLNTTNDPTGEMAWGIDDIMIVGVSEDSTTTANPSGASVATAISPTPVCHEDVNNPQITFTFTLNDFQCGGEYIIELSDDSCNFDNPIPFINLTSNGQSLPPGNYSVPVNVLIPTSIPAGDCYCFRVNRTSPPAFIGTPSTACFTIEDCIDSIAIADTPAVLKDPFGYMEICMGSVIDVPFYSYGAYNPSNQYYLELSDENGDFANAQTIGGPSPDTQTYDPAIYPPPVSPGNMSGKIPQTGIVPGCNYYIRVNSTDPVVFGRVWGPFCIKECDITTNETNDISVCTTDGCQSIAEHWVDIGLTTPADDFNVTFVGGDSLVNVVTSTAATNDWQWYINQNPIDPTTFIPAGSMTNFNYVFGCPGNYAISLDVGGNCTKRITKYVKVGNFNADFTYAVTGTQVSFFNNSSSDVDIVEYRWDVGEGPFLWDENPVKDYHDCGGRMPVTLRIMDENGCTTTFSDTIVVGDRLDNDFSWTANGQTLSITSTTKGAVDYWTWEFDQFNTLASNGKKLTDAVPPGTNGGQTQGTYGDPEHTYGVCGRYKVRFVMNDSGDVCFKIPVQLNSYNQGVTYAAGNKFFVQLLDNKTMAVVNEDSIGAELTTNLDSLLICVPNFTDYLGLGLQIKMYYMRIVSTDASDPDNMWGTIIRFTVTGISGQRISLTHDLIPTDTVECPPVGQPVCLEIRPPGLPATSQYRFSFSSGGSFTWRPPPQNPFHPPFVQPDQRICFNRDNFPEGWNYVTVQEMNGSGCVGPESRPDSFYILNSGVQRDFNGDFNVCQGDTVTYTADFFDGANGWYHFSQFGGKVVDYVPNTQMSVVWDSIGFGFFVSLTILGDQCAGDQFISKLVNVLPRAEAQITGDTVVCEGQTLELRGRNQTIKFNNGYDWVLHDKNAPGGVTLENGDILRGQVLNDSVSGDTVSVLLLTPHEDGEVIMAVDFNPPDGCIDVDTFSYQVLKSDVGGDTIDLCAGDSVQLQGAIAGDVESYVWSPSEGLSDPNNLQPWATPTAPIIYNLIADFKQGCSDTGSVVITLTPTDFQISPDDTIAPGGLAALLASGGNVISWSPDGSLDFPTASNPNASPDSTTTYTVKMQDDNGCERELDVTVYVFDPNIVVPTAFSPNGDGQNDIYIPHYLAIEELYSFAIFNRWGEKIFETTNLDQGWDGTYKGVPQEIGTYIFVVKARTILDTDRTFQGNVTLIR